MPDKVTARFKQILSELPEDKKRALYKRLSGIPADGRDSFIRQFVLKYDAGNTVKPKMNGSKHADRNIGRRVTAIVAAVLSLILIVKIISRRNDIAQMFSSLSRQTGISQSDSPESAADDGSSCENQGLEESQEPVSTDLTSATDTGVAQETSVTPTPVPLKSDHPDLSGLVIVIDPGHQAETDSDTETLAPDSTIVKPRCTSGAVGVSTNAREYEITLEVGLIAKSYLEECGADVIITRDTNDIDLSNQERANLAVAANPDIYIRLHADASPESETSGVRVFIPEDGSFVAEDTSLADQLGAIVAGNQGVNYLGTFATDAYTGLNYASSIRSFQLVMGYISNSDDEKRLTDSESQYELAVSIADFCALIK